MCSGSLMAFPTSAREFLWMLVCFRILTFSHNDGLGTGGFEGLPSHLREVLLESGSKDRGTWVHPDVAIQFAQWYSPAFALWVSRQIRHLMTYGEVNLHYQEWTHDQLLRGQQLNRDDITEIYGRSDE